MSRYRFIAAGCEYFPVRRLCQVLEVPARGYYAWQTGQQRAVAAQTPVWETALVKAFGVHQRRYGTRRLQVALREKGHRMATTSQTSTYQSKTGLANGTYTLQA